MEVYPHACFAALLGRLPFPKHTLEGRLQRQLALFDCKIKVSDPMLVFEEITRHRLLQGILPLEELYGPEELDAMVAAYTAWIAGMQPDQVSRLGDPEEGYLVLPVPELRDRYS
jgi:predicted RNase H-like nuclease